MLSINLKGLQIIAISDTHGRHRLLAVPEADVIIHTGDACEDGNEDQLLDFFYWFSKLPVQYKIFVVGNHDLVFELEPERAKEMIPDNVTFLENEEIMWKEYNSLG